MSLPLIHNWYETHRSGLMAADSTIALCRYLAANMDKVFEWDSFFYSEQVQTTRLYRMIYSVDQVDGKRREFLFSDDPAHDYDILPALLHGKPLLINRGPSPVSDVSPKTSDRFLRFGDEARPSASLLFTPIIIGGQLRAVLSIQSYKPYCFNEADRDRFHILAGLISPIVQRIYAESELRQISDRYRQAIAQANAVPYERDYATGAITYMGEGIREMTGYTSDELTPEIWKSLVREMIQLGDAAGLTKEEALRQSHGGVLNRWRAEYRLRRRDGQECWVADSSINLFDEADQCYGSLGILQDITAQKRAARLREELSHLGQRLSAVVSRKEAADLAAGAADRLLGWDACFISLYDQDRRKVQPLLAMDTVEGARKEFVEYYGQEAEPGPYFQRTLIEGHVLIAARENLNQEGVHAFGDEERRSQSLIYVAIHAGERALGVFSIQSYTPGAYTEESLTALRLLADYCGAAMARAAAIEQLQERDYRYRRTIAQANAVPYEHDVKAGVYSYMGEGIFDLTGYTVEEMTPDLWTTLVQEVMPHGSPDSFVYAGDGKFERSGRRRSWRADYRIKTKDGENRWVADSSISVLDTSGEAISYIGLLIDITDRRRTQEINEALSALGQGISAVISLKDAARLVVNTADRLIGWDAAYLTICNSDRTMRRRILTYDIVDGRRTEVPIEGPELEPVGPVFKKVLADGPQLILRDGVEADTPWPLTTQFGNKEKRSESLIFVPLQRAGQEPIGILSIQSYQPFAYTEEDVRLLQLLAGHCTAAIERVIAEEKLQASEKQTALMAALANRLNAARLAKEAGGIIADVADQLLKWDSFNLDLYDESQHTTSDVLNFDTVDGRKVVFHPSERAAPPSVFGQRVLAEGAFLLLREPSGAIELESGNAPTPFGDTQRRSESLMFAPVRFRDHVVGILSIQSYTPKAYTAANLETLQTLADYCGGALARIRTETALALERQHISALADLGRHLSAARTPEEAARLALQTAQTLIGWDSSFVAMCWNGAQIVKPIVSFDIVDGCLKEVSRQFPEGPLNPQGHVYRTIHEGAQIVLRSETGEAPGQESRPFGDVQRLSASLLFAPVRRGDKVIGIFSIQSYTPQAYSPADLDTLQTLADHCAGVLERIHAERALIEERHLLRTLIDNLPDSIYFKDREGRFLISNVGHLKQLAMVSGRDIADPDQVLGKTDFEFFPPSKAATFRAEESHIIETGEMIRDREESSTDETGRETWMSATKVPLIGDQGDVTGVVGITRDITAFKEAQAQLQRAAYYDALTGLPNRALFMDRLRHSVARSRRDENHKYALLFMDLDKFKDVNDRLGHLGGDELLRQVGERLKDNVRESDTVARLGGDEFTILLEDFHSFDQVRQVADRLMVDLGWPVPVAGQFISTNASIGITLSDRGYSDIESILRDADTALYLAKEQGRGRYVIFGEL